MKTLHVVKRGEWRNWLKANGKKEKEVWLVFYKRHTGRARLAEMLATLRIGRKLGMK